MRRGENPTEVLAGVHAAVDELNATGLPSGVKNVVPIYDRTDLVNNTPPHGDAHAPRRARDRARRAVPVPRQRARGAADGDHHPALAAIRVHLYAFFRHPGELAELGRARFRNHRGRHADHGRAHRPRAGDPPLGVASGHRDGRDFRNAALEVERPIFLSRS